MLSDEEQIRALVQTWQSATKSGDIDAVLGLMTDDVCLSGSWSTTNAKGGIYGVISSPNG
jgi:uncharacterized protein (TIGR02246 family)